MVVWLNSLALCLHDIFCFRGTLTYLFAIPPQSGVERIRLLQIALHSAIRNAIILAILFAIQIENLDGACNPTAIQYFINRNNNRFYSLKNLGTTLQGRTDSPVRAHEP